jgi:hypothetical protein
MITNMGVIDRVLRLTVGAMLLAWSYGKGGPALHEGVSWLVWVMGAALALTGMFRYCPLYAFLGTDSCAPYPGDVEP